MNRLVKILIIFQVVLLMTGCSSLPDNISKTPSYSYQDTNNTKLGKAIQPLAKAQLPKSGFIPLAGGVDAFTARYILSNAAERSIDAQYYLWHGDITGKLLLHALLQAADRGVRVRLLLDDINMDGKDNMLLAIHRHPNVE